MPAFLRCEHCRNLFSTPSSETEAECPHCGTATIVGEAIAALPTPQLPGEERPAELDLDDEPVDEQDEVFGEPGRVGRAVQKSTPWTIAVLANLAVMLILMFISIIVGGDRVGAEIIVPNSNLVDNPGGALTPHEFKDPSPPEQPLPEKDPRRGDRDLVVNDILKDKEEIDVIGRGLSGASNGDPNGFGDGSTGTNEPGFLGPKRPDGGNVHHVVYLIDRSGSMGQGGKMLLLRQQLLLSINRLSPKQDFHVIMFSGQRGESPKEKTPARLTQVNHQSLTQVCGFLDNIGEAQGNTVAASAVRRAFDVLKEADPKRPGKLIYLLTDGQLGDREEVFRALDDLNKTKSVKINTLLLSEDEDTGAAQTLRRIATTTGGRYKHVSMDEAH
jgi:hypothetical protein